jgi:DNA-binding MarR family transcriptional regulator
VTSVAQLNSLARRIEPDVSVAHVSDRESVEAIDYGPLARWVGFHLRLAQTASFQAFAREAEGVDLSPGRFATLILIDRNPGISQTALSRANARDKSTLTPMLDDLERRGLIKRVRPRNDRRSYRLMLTQAGEDMLKQLTRCAERYERNLDQLIGARDRARFVRILRKLAAELPVRSRGRCRPPPSEL